MEEVKKENEKKNRKEMFKIKVEKRGFRRSRQEGGNKNKENVNTCLFFSFQFVFKDYVECFSPNVSYVNCQDIVLTAT